MLSQTITVPSETRSGNTYAAFTAVQHYGYDALNRLQQADEKPSGYTAAQCSANPAQCWRQTFLYDRYGNRNFDTGTDADGPKTTLPLGCATAVCNPAVDPATNKLIGYGFDNAGNTRTDASGKQFTYDGENKQVEVRNAANSIVGQYTYDGDGKRVRKIALDQTAQQLVTTIFVYDAGGKLVAEYANPSTVSTAQVSYLTSDHLGSPRINTNENGAVISRHDYQPFGEEVTRTSYGSDDVRKQFTGYERDTESELDFAEARYYNPAHGRFTAVDPLMASASTGNPQTWNRYIYVGNNPLNITDPTGLSWYYNSAQNEYKWYGDNDTVGEGYTSVVGTTGNDSRGVGSFVYQNGRDGGWVSLSSSSNSWNSFDTQADALKNFEGQCASCQALVNSVAENAETKGTTVAIVAATGVAVGATGGLAMAATGTAAGAGITTLGLTEAGTGVATTTAAVVATHPEETTQAVTAVEEAGSSFFQGTRYTDKVLGQMKTGDFHAFPESVRAFESAGRVTNITGGDGVVRQMLRIPGGYGNSNGFFEFIKEQNGNINHRFFNTR